MFYGAIPEAGHARHSQRPIGVWSRLQLVLRSARYLAVAAQALANILDLDQVVLTGPSFALAGSLYVPAIRERLARSFFARASHPVDVVISPHASDAAAIGGAALVLQGELAPRRSSQMFPAVVRRSALVHSRLRWPPRPSLTIESPAAST